jgi:two-component system, NarL family, sensor histidine kinase EvgS
MPRVDGYELARMIRAREQEAGLERTPIVALSANVMQGEPDRCRAVGMDDFAAKPTTIPALSGRLHRWLPYLDWTPPATELAEAANGGGGFDRSVLEILTGGDAELAESVVEDFVQTTTADLEELTESLPAQDLGQLRRQAHRIKGAARIVGAHEITALSEKLEVMASGGEPDWDDVSALADGIGRALERVRAAV